LPFYQLAIPIIANGNIWQAAICQFLNAPRHSA